MKITQKNKFYFYLKLQKVSMYFTKISFILGLNDFGYKLFNYSCNKINNLIKK